MTEPNAKKIVLLVDDAPANLAVLSEILKASYQIRAAKSGALALKIAHAPTPPDVILLDVEMPEMDGYEVCQKLKADAATQAIPVLFVTGHTQPEQEAKGMALGAIGYISKPVEPSVVLAKVAQAVS